LKDKFNADHEPWVTFWEMSIFKQKQTNVQTVTAVFMCSFGCGLSWEHVLEWDGGFGSSCFYSKSLGWTL